MSSSLVITLAVIGGVAWLVFLGVSAVRARGKEEVPRNLAPGLTDDELETRRLERVQQAAVLLSAFMAVGLPLYFLGEEDRQSSFVVQFDDESVLRGEHLVTEFACFNCHGAGGSGGGAPYIEKRLGVATQWFAPSLDDVFYRYEPAEVNFWITYGRPNTPMPAWGVAGGGAMNEQQVQDIVNYLQSHQIPQQDSLARIQANVNGQLQRLEGAEAAVAALLATQEQLVKDILRAKTLAPAALAISEQMRDVLDSAASGVDTDGDALSDTAETQLGDLSRQFADIWALPGVTEMVFDPANPASNGTADLDVVNELLATLTVLVPEYPSLYDEVAAIEAAVAATGDDQDGDDLTDESEAAITTQLGRVVASVRPAAIRVVEFSPTDPESSGARDSRTASQVVSAAESASLQLTTTTDNEVRLLPSAEQGLARMREAASNQKWVVDIAGVADDAFSGDATAAARAVGLFNAYCARCHTAGWSAGVVFTQESGSGGLGPALWEGRPNVQFLAEADLIKFLTDGSAAQQAYGVNGIGTGRMPGFGKVLSAEDIQLIATYLRSGNLRGLE